MTIQQVGTSQNGTQNAKKKTNPKINCITKV